jgi:hypothetical protein
MTPAPLSARRLPPLGCALAVLAALALSACGGDGAATAESGAAAPEGATPARPKQQPKATPARAARPCPAKVGTFVESLDRLRRRLAVGLSYEQYAAQMKGLRASYDQIPVGHLAIDCLTRTGSPAEKAFNHYIDAANAWGECLADASCTTAAIEPVLQRKWRVASGFLSEAR